MISKSTDHPLFLIFLLTTANIVFSAGKLLPLNDTNMPCNAIHIAASDIYKEVLKAGETMVLVNLEDAGAQKKSNKHLKYTFYNINTNKNMTSINARDRSLITLSSYYVRRPEVLDKALKRIKFFSVNNPSRNTLLVDLSEDTYSKIIPRYFEVLWKNHFMRPIIIKMRANSTEEIVDIYRWPTLEPLSKCGKNTFNYRNVGFYIPKNGTFTFFKSTERFFDMAPPHFITDCDLKVSVVIYPPFVFPPEHNSSNYELIFKRGFEIKLINTIAEHFGLSIKFKISRDPLTWGSLEANGSATGVYKDLIAGDADIAISSLTYMPKDEFVEFGPTYAFEDMIWCVPDPSKGESWINLLCPYRIGVFILYQLAFFLTSITLCLLSNLKDGEPKHNRQLGNCIFRCTADIFGNTYDAYAPKTPVVRIFYTVWLIFTIHMTVLYSGALFSKLTLPWENYKHLTYDEILDSSLQLLIFSSTKTYVQDNNPFTKKLISRKFKYCLSLPMCLESVAITGDSAICLTSSMALFAKNRHWAIVCQKSAKLISFPVTMIFRKHHYLHYEISKKILRLFEVGLVDYWRREAIKSFKFPDVVHPDFDKLDNTAVFSFDKIITFHHIKPAFGILISGNFFAFGVFLIELGFHFKKMYDKYKLDAETAYVGFSN